ncbi:MAG: hypothetical protein AVDCRST_MAG19-3048, partial [uncultured Thermomicrobiales bacterium]
DESPPRRRAGDRAGAGPRARRPDRAGAGAACRGRALGVDLRGDEGVVCGGDAAGVHLRPLRADDPARLRRAAGPAAGDGAATAASGPGALRRRRAQRLHPLPTRLRARARSHVPLLQLPADRDGAALHRPDPGTGRGVDAAARLARAGRRHRRRRRLPPRSAGRAGDAARGRAEPRGGGQLRHVRDRQPAARGRVPARDVHRLHGAGGRGAADCALGAGRGRPRVGACLDRGVDWDRLHGRSPGLRRVHALELGHREAGRGGGHRLQPAGAGSERWPLGAPPGGGLRTGEGRRRGARPHRARDCEVAAAGVADRAGGGTV